MVVGALVVAVLAVGAFLLAREGKSMPAALLAAGAACLIGLVACVEWENRRAEKAHAHLEEARRLSAAGKSAEALSEPDKAIDAHPAAHEALLARGDLRQEQGNFADAIGDYTKSLAHMPERSLHDIGFKAYFERAKCFAKLKDWSRADADLVKAGEVQPYWTEEVAALRKKYAEEAGK